jgi:hypothetical protein
VERHLRGGVARPGRGRLLLEPERELAELESVAVLEPALEDTEPADERPVPAPEVEDARPVRLDVDPGVDPRQARVEEDDVVLARRPIVLPPAFSGKRSSGAPAPGVRTR